MREPARHVVPTLRGAAGALPWIGAGVAAWALDGVADLGGQALPLVLAAAVSGLWWPISATALAGLLATLAFNWSFVAPRGTLHVSVERDLLLLVTLWSVSLGVAALVGRQRQLARTARQQARRMEQLYRLSERLRAAADVDGVLSALTQALRGSGWSARYGVAVPPPGEGAWSAALSDDERDGLRLCAERAEALGPGTGRFDNLGQWYLPLRGRAGTPGAVVVQGADGALSDTGERDHLQTLCDLAGQALEQLQQARAAASAQQVAQDQTLRSTLLAAISHDYRTPLAAIVGAASSLSQQGPRLSDEQRQRLSDAIVDEASQLSRLTDNALQLARLGAQPLAVSTDWHSVEELVGVVLRRARARESGRRIRARIDRHLPLVRCDAVLISQFLENLLDNALKYSADTTRVELLGRRHDGRLWLGVRDRGPGIDEHQRARLTRPFERGDAARTASVRGAGVGLALCQAVAQAHGSALELRARRGGGLHAGAWLRLEPAPLPEPEGAAP